MQTQLEPTLLERESELAIFRALLAATPRDTGRLAVVEGPPGIGKTRLLAEIKQQAREAGLRVLSARATELESELSFGIVRQLFEPALAGSDDLLAGPAAPAAAVVDPAGPVEPVRGHPDASFSTLHGLYWLTANLAAQDPLLLAIDDLHWCDAPSLRWLAYLLPRLEDLPLLVVGTSRPLPPHAHDSVLAQIVAEPVATVVHPAPLSPGAAAEILHTLLSPDADAAFCAACHAETGGNPLYVRLLARAVAAEGVEPTAAGAARLKDLGARAVRRHLGLRLSRLGPEATATAKAVAVLGDGTEVGLVEALAELDEAATHAALGVLGAADVLRGDGPPAFVHPVVRAAVESHLGPADLDLAHRRAAMLLTDAGTEPERVAAHLLKTRPQGDARTVVTLRDAARAAMARGAPDSAVAYLTRALSEPPLVHERAGVLAELGLAESLVNGPAAAEHLEEALELVTEPTAQAELALMLGRTLYFLARSQEAIGVYERALEQVGPEPGPLRRMLEAALSHTLVTVEGLAVAAPEYEAAARTAGDSHGDLGAHWLQALLAYRDAHAGGTADDVAALAQGALSGGVIVAEDNGGGGFAIAVLVALAADRDLVGFLDTSLARAHAGGSTFAFAATKVFRSRARFLRGDLGDAESDAREALEACERWEIAIGLAYAAAYLADALQEQGRLDEAAAALARAKPTSFVHSHWLHESRARQRLLQGDLRGGVDDLLAAGEQMEAYGLHNPAFMPWRSLAAAAFLALGEQDKARELADEELALSRRWGAPRTLSMSLRAAGLARGGADGLRLLEEAVAVAEKSPARLEHAKALLELGATLRRANQRTEAREALRRALELASVCGARALAQRAETELLATGARPRRFGVSGLDALTPSERRVAEMAARGTSNREIAQALFVTTKTVEVHLSSAYRKLSIGSRAQLPRALETA